MKYYEVNFDGQISPTHNFSGLSIGNLASINSKNKLANPDKASQEWLNKFNLLTNLGIHQYSLPIHSRPNKQLLEQIGVFNQTDFDKLDEKLKNSLLSASSMWAANAATVSPSCDTLDGKLHITPANLQTYFHRLIETSTTKQNLANIFNDSQLFTLHQALPNHTWFADEGSANHIRLSPDHGVKGLNIFIYGFDPMSPVVAKLIYPARQSKQAGLAIARKHKLDPDYTLHIQQNPNAINAGVFHNDVISVGNENLFFYHQLSFANTAAVIAKIKQKWQDFYPNKPLYLIEITEQELSLKQAVQTYLFNSQIVTLPDQKMALICPVQCKKNQVTADIIKSVLQGDNPIQSVHFVDLSESMANGGGPACLRLRVVLNQKELKSITINNRNGIGRHS
ncbi:N-succinylarginine dihydrolase [Catenovulum maritimum]|uniref:N-succinylarginine dihydrolase n=1 Tax=Catenovulum maritimum TaxID=1513271 RepID=UPI000660AB51|nr:N-succinylarginine dihydrolase [Catenovulum maritimum]